jgi:hypothetical protein
MQVVFCSAPILQNATNSKHFQDKLNLPRNLLPQGTIFAAGYINNYMKPLVDMIGMLDAEVNPAKLCNPVPREKVKSSTVRWRFFYHTQYALPN